MEANNSSGEKEEALKQKSNKEQATNMEGKDEVLRAMLVECLG